MQIELVNASYCENVYIAPHTGCVVVHCARLKISYYSLLHKEVDLTFIKDS